MDWGTDLNKFTQNHNQMTVITSWNIFFSFVHRTQWALPQTAANFQCRHNWQLKFTGNCLLGCWFCEKPISDGNALCFTHSFFHFCYYSDYWNSFLAFAFIAHFSALLLICYFKFFIFFCTFFFTRSSLFGCWFFMSLLVLYKLNVNGRIKIVQMTFFFWSFDNWVWH